MSNLVVVAAIGIVLIVLMLVLMVSMRPKARRPMKPKEYNAELFRRRMTLDEMPFEVVHDVRVRDSGARVIRVDHVVRLPASILMVTSAPPDVAGPVKANPNAGTWRYVGAANAVKTMPNPVLQCHPLIQAVRSRFPLVRVRVLTVFPPAAQFSDKPKHVCHSDDFEKTLKAMATEDGVESQAVVQAWEPLSKAFMQASQGAAATAGMAGPPGTGARRAVS
jgi:hypothetical protein